MNWARPAGAVVAVLLAGTVVTADTVPYSALAGPMMARAEQWFQTQPVYDQDACYGVGAGYGRTDWNGVLGGCHEPYYRTDCSGFVSMAWGLPVSYATPRKGLEHDLTDVSSVITKEQLRTGDALLAWGKHVRLFEQWTDATRTSYVAYDFGATPVRHKIFVWGAPGEYSYVPIRYTPNKQ
jgi:hypothetical protein